jgi:hypothetical protein
MLCMAVIAANSVLWGEGTIRTIGRADGPLRILQDQDIVGFYSGDRQLLEYRCTESPRKPYLSKLYSPAGVQILRDSPSDHKHHHALMFALSADKVNFWEENEAATGVERQTSPGRSWQRSLEGVSSLGFTHELAWMDLRSGKPLLTERRTVEFLPAEDIPATLLTWRSRLAPATAGRSVELGGAHYFGLGMRFVESMDTGGQFLNSEGAEGELVRGSERLTPAHWAAYYAAVDGRLVTVALFDHAANLRHPARMFTMSTPFACLAATLNLWKEPWILGEGKPLELSYGVALWDGRIDAKQIGVLYRRWLDLALEK